MSEQKNTTLLSTIAGLALCGFMTACCQADKNETAAQQASLDEAIKEQERATGQRVNAMATVVEVMNLDPGEYNCRYMLMGIRISNGEVSQQSQDIIYKRCPN